MKTRLGPGQPIRRDAADPAIGDTIAASDQSGRASGPLVGAAASATAGEPGRGDSIGRFVVLGVLGEGGMGVVYSAYDPHLDRKVAIKLLGSTTRAEDNKVRLLREAQAMAKINDPNVIKVHEVGTHGEQIYLAMEFADAGTVRSWLKAADRSQRDILAAFRAAGRGLAAAHAVGLVHRDFKPDNVMMSKDGGIRVTDFGLVSVSEAIITRAATDPPMPEIERSLSDTTPLSQDLTRTGSVMGTPTYMAPEQFTSRGATAQTDQFAFCVALYEALYGERPFAGASYTELSTNVLLGEVKPAPAKSQVPPWIRRVLVRGLDTDPAKRHPSMTALLAALERDPRSRRKRVLAMAGAAIGAAAIATVAVVALSSNAGPACGTGDDRIAAVWNPPLHDKLEHAFTAAGRPNAAASFERVTKLVDAWTGGWKVGYVDACRATRIRGEQSEHVLDLRMQCLTRRLDDARTTLDVLAAGGNDVIDHAFDAALGLPSVAACADAATLAAAVAQPETELARTQVAAVRAKLDAARAQRRFGRFAPALAAAREALATARATSYPPIVAEALIATGELQSDLADPASVATFTEAMRVAAAAGDSNALIDAATRRTLELTNTSRFEMAEELGALADAMAQHAHPPAELAVRLDNTMGLLLSRRAHLKEARARYDQALARAKRELGPDHPVTMTTMNQLGNLLKQEGHFDEARKVLEEVLAIHERVEGKDHPNVATALTNLGNVDRIEGKLDDAKRLYDRALAIRIAALGPEHPEVGTAYNNLGTVYADKGDQDTAIEDFRKAITIEEKVYGSDSPEIANALSNLGGAFNAKGDHDAARAQYERALKLLEKAHGPNHPDVATALGNLGVVAVDSHRFEEGLALYQRAEVIAEQVYGPDHPDVADYMANITSVYKQMGKLREAQEMTSRTMSVIAKAYGPDHMRMAGALINFGNLQMLQDNYAGALETFQRALSIFETKLGKDHPYVAFAANGISGALVELKRPAEAVPFAERSLAIRLATKQPPELTAEAHFRLADALVTTPKTRTRAIAEAKIALEEYKVAKDDHDVSEVTIWLKKH